MPFLLQPWQFFFVILVGWVHREQQKIILFYQAELETMMKVQGKKRLPLNERHLYRILTAYFDYYHNSRPHLSLDRNSPTPREVEPPSQGEVVSIPQVGGLHHRYTRAA